MTNASKYWRFVQLDATGQCSVIEISAAKAFFQQQFPHWSDRDRMSDSDIQRTLLSQMQQGKPEEQRWAEGCLRCFISNQIRQICRQLEAQFGSHHGVKAKDLLPFVLDDAADPWSGRERPTSKYQSFATQILQSFDPERGSLSTWTIRLVRNHRELNRCLLEQGVYMVSDWAILNDTRPRQLPRILGEFHSLTPLEIANSEQLLQSYHAVYRRDRIQQRQSGNVGRCTPPTITQLREIAQLLTSHASPLTPELTLAKLQSLASLLRQYRIAVRGGSSPLESLDQPEVAREAKRLQASESPEDEVEYQFLQFYRQQFEQCLEQVIAEVTCDRIQYLQRRKSPADQQFLTALQLFHCRGQAMGQIAHQVGLKQQYQVTRLLKLKEFRADIQQRLFLLLRDRVLEQARRFETAQSAQTASTLQQNIEVAIDHQLTELMQEAELEASANRDQPFQNLFARKLCQHLDTRSLAS
ncbi:MAG: hypothetical protein ACTS2F_19495 [Thainema sp.]